MALTPSREVVPNYGMGLITYICDEVGPARKDGETLAAVHREPREAAARHEALSARQLEGRAAAAGAAGSLRALEADVRSGEAISEAHRLSRDDEQSGHSGFSAAGISARQDPDGQAGRVAEAHALRAAL